MTNERRQEKSVGGSFKTDGPAATLMQWETIGQVSTFVLVSFVAFSIFLFFSEQPFYVKRKRQEEIGS